MTRWIAFDPETTSLLRSNLAHGTRIETLRRGPVDYALARAGAVITLLPDMGIAVFRPSRHLPTQHSGAARPAVAVQPAAAPLATPTTTVRPNAGRVGTRASGFLGLSDEVFEEEEVAEEKKGWWKRLWEE